MNVQKTGVAWGSFTKCGVAFECTVSFTLCVLIPSNSKKCLFHSDCSNGNMLISLLACAFFVFGCRNFDLCLVQLSRPP